MEKTKDGRTYYLSSDVTNWIEQKALEDNRTPSRWVDLHFAKLMEKEKAKK